jgi:amino acid transporter
MRMFAVLAGLLVGGGIVMALRGVGGFSLGAWYTGILLVVFAFVGRASVGNSIREAKIE